MMNINRFFVEKAEIPSWILSDKLERQLTLEEREIYYEKLYSYCKKRKLAVTTKGALTVAPKLKGITNKIANMVTKCFSSRCVEKVVTGLDNIPGGSVVFASTHQGILDNFVWIPDNPKHTLIVQSVETNKLLLMAQFNTGLILVTKNKDYTERRVQAKLDMISTLIKGHSIWICPETAWNLSPNKLHLPMNYGFLDVARKANVPIIPVIIDYTYDSSTGKEKIKKIHIHYSKAICVNKEDDLKEKLNEYMEVVSTHKWNFIIEKGVFKRNSISNYEYISFLRENYKNLELGKIDIEKEREGIQGSQNAFYLFHHINDIPFDEYGNLLETPEVVRLKMINLLHGI